MDLAEFVIGFTGASSRPGRSEHRRRTKTKNSPSRFNPAFQRAELFYRAVMEPDEPSRCKVFILSRGTSSVIDTQRR
jgi:hypothetical protein